MPASVLLAQFFLPLSAVNLGRFVTNVDEPHRDFHDPVCDPSYDITEKVQAKFDSVHRSVNHSSFASELTSFLCSSFSKRSKTSIRITADQVKTYYLNNTGQWFRDAVQSEHTRKWIERTIDEGDEIYVVVGYHTVLDARIVERSGEQRTTGGSLTIPVSTALPSAGVTALFGSLTDPSLAGSRGRIEDEQRCFVAPGEQICAVQYHKVRHRWFASSKQEKMTLAKETRWERYDRPRYLESDRDDSVEVELVDDLALEGERDTCTMESGEIIFSVTDYQCEA